MPSKRKIYEYLREGAWRSAPPLSKSSGLIFLGSSLSEEGCKALTRSGRCRGGAFF